MTRLRSKTLAAFLTIGPVCAASAQLQPPPGAVSPSFKDLDTIEARTPIIPGVTPGTSDSVVSIGGGSYYLTADIIAGSGEHGIRISADNCTLDLNGFTVRGLSGSLSGILVDGSRRAVAVRNGHVAGFGTGGIDAPDADFARIEGVRVTQCAGDGVLVGDYSMIRDCYVDFVGGRGIAAGSTGLIRDCLVTNAGSTGIETGIAHRIVGCNAVSGDGDGMRTGSYSNITESTSTANREAGIVAAFSSAVRRSLSSSNGGPSTGDPPGIEVGQQSHVTGCQVDDANGGNGIVAFNDSRVSRTTVTGAQINGIVGSGFFTGCNVSSCGSDGLIVTGVVRACSAVENGANGIAVGGSSWVVLCTAQLHGPQGTTPYAGINPDTDGGLVERCYAAGNRVGIRGDSDSFGAFCIVRNVAIDNVLSGGGSANYPTIDSNVSGSFFSNPTGAGPWDNLSQ